MEDSTKSDDDNKRDDESDIETERKFHEEILKMQEEFKPNSKNVNLNEFKDMKDLRKRYYNTIMNMKPLLYEKFERNEQHYCAQLEAQMMKESKTPLEIGEQIFKKYSVPGAVHDGKFPSGDKLKSAGVFEDMDVEDMDHCPELRDLMKRLNDELKKEEELLEKIQEAKKKERDELIEEEKQEGQELKKKFDNGCYDKKLVNEIRGLFIEPPPKIP